VLPKLAVRVRFCFARSLQGATLTVELVGRRRYQTRAKARASIFTWIAWYNRRRLHSTNGYLSPVEWEHRHATPQPPPSTWAA
jgi:transposase InsO family protein